MKIKTEIKKQDEVIVLKTPSVKSQQTLNFNSIKFKVPKIRFNDYAPSDIDLKTGHVSFGCQRLSIFELERILYQLAKKENLTKVLTNGKRVVEYTTMNEITEKYYIADDKAYKRTIWKHTLKTIKCKKLNIVRNYVSYNGYDITPLYNKNKLIEKLKVLIFVLKYMQSYVKGEDFIIDDFIIVPMEIYKDQPKQKITTLSFDEYDSNYNIKYKDGIISVPTLYLGGYLIKYKPKDKVATLLSRNNMTVKDIDELIDILNYKSVTYKNVLLRDDQIVKHDFILDDESAKYYIINRKLFDKSTFELKHNYTTHIDFMKYGYITIKNMTLGKDSDLELIKEKLKIVREILLYLQNQTD